LGAGDKAGKKESASDRRLIEVADDRFRRPLEKLSRMKTTERRNMGRTLEELTAAEAPETQARIEARFAELMEEAKGLAEIRRLAVTIQLV
jgi:hypothetical protein